MFTLEGKVKGNRIDRKKKDPDHMAIKRISTKIPDISQTS